MRYDLRLKDVPKSCACGKDYSINHCLSCKNGGFIHMRHNIVRDSVHELLQEICKDVKLEPMLLPVTNEELPAGSNVTDGARADVSSLGFWNPLSRAFFDIRVVNPLAETNWKKESSSMYKDHEKAKKKEYNDRILEIEKGTFTPLVFSCCNGAGTEATKFIKHLATRVSDKRQEQYSLTVSYIRRRIRFDILKTCVISFRGERKTQNQRRELHEIDFGTERVGLVE